MWLRLFIKNRIKPEIKLRKEFFLIDEKSSKKKKDKKRERDKKKKNRIFFCHNYPLSL
jgi:hypothetical protein